MLFPNSHAEVLLQFIIYGSVSRFILLFCHVDAHTLIHEISLRSAAILF